MASNTIRPSPSNKTLTPQDSITKLMDTNSFDFSDVVGNAHANNANPRQLDLTPELADFLKNIDNEHMKKPKHIPAPQQQQQHPPQHPPAPPPRAAPTPVMATQHYNTVSAPLREPPRVTQQTFHAPADNAPPPRPAGHYNTITSPPAQYNQPAHYNTISAPPPQFNNSSHYNTVASPPQRDAPRVTQQTFQPPAEPRHYQQPPTMTTTTTTTTTQVTSPRTLAPVYARQYTSPPKRQPVPAPAPPQVYMSPPANPPPSSAELQRVQMQQQQLLRQLAHLQNIEQKLQSPPPAQPVPAMQSSPSMHSVQSSSSAHSVASMQSSPSQQYSEWSENESEGGEEYLTSPRGVAYEDPQPGLNYEQLMESLAPSNSPIPYRKHPEPPQVFSPLQSPPPLPPREEFTSPNPYPAPAYAGRPNSRDSNRDNTTYSVRAAHFPVAGPIPHYATVNMTHNSRPPVGLVLNEASILFLGIYLCY